MLLNKLRDTNKLIKLRSDSNEINRELIELKAVNQKLKGIRDLLMNYSISMQTLNKIYSNEFNKEDLNSLEYHISKIEAGLKVGYVETKSLELVNSKIIELERDLKERWKTHYEAQTQSLRMTIVSIENIVPDQNEAFRVINSLDPNKSQWPVNDARIDLINSNINLGNSIIANLGVNKEIEVFLSKISSNKATIFDLTPDILNWIKDKNLEGKIGLTFK